jgi:uncharacterized membrane protein
MELVLLIAIVFLAVVFGLPIAAWISARHTRSKLADLEGVIDEQRRELEGLHRRLLRFEQQRSTAAAADVEQRPSTIERRMPPEVEEMPVVAPLADTRVDETEVAPEPIEAPTPAATQVFAPAIDEVAAGGPDITADGDQQPPWVPPIEPPPPPSPPPPGFDWESIVGVKLFSAIAGIALVVAAVFFLRYSMEHGWLQPAVRVAIGVVVAVGLLVACELKAARRYPATANALDAAAIAILFSTFFAAHALWNLIPALVTFGLLALVTALAVLLSIRRESLFIAVLGLLGGFATPALLSTGENRPIPLFTYLLLLNIGLAWVAYRNRWPILTWLTLILTTLYQWGWVFKFLDRSTVPLAMGVFLVFPLAAVVGIVIAKRNVPMDARTGEDESFERSALISAAVPAVFAVFLAAVPAYGAHPALLFAFVLLVDVGLMAIALARGEELLHATGAVTTLLTFAVWLAVSYESTAAQKIVLPTTGANR